MSEKSCQAIGCHFKAVWVSKCKSAHSKPRLVTTYWCDTHAKQIYGLHKGATWEKLSLTSPAAT